MLIAAVVAMVVTVALGLWLASLHLIPEKPPQRVPVVGIVHALAGATATGALLLALRGPPRGVQTGAGSFGWIAFGTMALALLGGLTVLGLHLRRRGAPSLVIAAHALLGITGGVVMAAWYASPSSYGH